MSTSSQDWTIERYLAFERPREDRHEFVSNEVRSMAPPSISQSLTIGNIGTSLHTQLRPTPNKAYMIQMRIRAGNNYLYPNIVAVRGKSETEDQERDTLVNPTLIAEVVLPQTEAYDRGRKFHIYQAIPTLEEYVLISVDSYRVERFLRQNAAE